MKLSLSGCSITICFALGGELFTFVEGRVEENVLLRPYWHPEGAFNMHSHCLGELAYFCGAKSVEYQPTSTLMGWADMGTMSG